MGQAGGGWMERTAGCEQGWGGGGQRWGAGSSGPSAWQLAGIGKVRAEQFSGDTELWGCGQGEGPGGQLEGSRSLHSFIHYIFPARGVFQLGAGAVVTGAMGGLEEGGRQGAPHSVCWASPLGGGDQRAEVSTSRKLPARDRAQALPQPPGPGAPGWGDSALPARRDLAQESEGRRLNSLGPS